MATKEDILEQIVEEYLISRGYFVRHNLKFLPPHDHPDYVSKDDSNHSDIDVLGYHPTLQGPSKVWAVSCKSWQAGFNAATWLTNIEHNKVVSGRPAWKHFRELTSDKWSRGFVAAIHAATGTREFTYVTAVAHIVGSPDPWQSSARFSEAMGGNPIRVISFVEMVREMQETLSTTLAGSEVGRLLQMFAVAGIRAR